MKDAATTKFKLDLKALPVTDWSRFDAMSEAEREAAAKADSDSQPATDEELVRARRPPDAGAVRRKLGLTQEEFAAKFHIPLGTLRDWEQGARRPDRSAQVLLAVIASNPDAVVKALEEAGV